MIVPALSVLADENVDREIVERLRSDGHDVAWVKERASVVSTPDPNVLAIATAEGRLLLTADRDFGDMVYRDRQPAPHGVVLMRLGDMPTSQKATIVGDAILTHGHLLRAHFTVIAADCSVRVRELPR